MTIVFLAAQATDLIITLILGAAFGGSVVEVNPVMRTVWESFGVLGLIGVKAAVVLALLAVIYWVGHRAFLTAVALISWSLVMGQAILLVVLR